MEKDEEAESVFSSGAEPSPFIPNFWHRSSHLSEHTYSIYSDLFLLSLSNVHATNTKNQQKKQQNRAVSALGKSAACCTRR